jgi:hypothetical protein
VSTAKRIGGYVYRQEVARVRAATSSARGYVERILSEKPGPALTALYLAHVGIELGVITEAAGVLDEIGRDSSRCGAQNDK